MSIDGDEQSSLRIRTKQMKRCSPLASESATVNAFGSSRDRAASAKSTLCFLRFVAALTPSHSYPAMIVSVCTNVHRRQGRKMTFRRRLTPSPRRRVTVRCNCLYVPLRALIGISWGPWAIRSSSMNQLDATTAPSVQAKAVNKRAAVHRLS